MKRNKNFFFILRIFIGGGLLFALFKLVPFKDIIDIYKTASKFYIFLAFSLIFLGHIIGALRWKFVLNFLGIPISFKEALYAFLSGTFFVLIFPSFLASDVFRGVVLSKRFKNRKKAFFSVFIDRLSGLVALAGIVSFSYILGKSLIKEKEVLWAVVGMFLLGMCTFFIIFSKSIFPVLKKIFKRVPKVKEKIESLRGEFAFLRKNPSLFFKTIVYFSLPIQITTILSFFYSAKAFALSISFIHFFILIPIIMVIAFLPLTIAGLGTRDMACVYFFSKLGVSEALSFSLSLLNFAFMVSISLLGGVVYVMVYHRWMESGK